MMLNGRNAASKGEDTEGENWIGSFERINFSDDAKGKVSLSASSGREPKMKNEPQLIPTSPTILH